MRISCLRSLRPSGEHRPRTGGILASPALSPGANGGTSSVATPHEAHTKAARTHALSEQPLSERNRDRVRARVRTKLREESTNV